MNRSALAFFSFLLLITVAVSAQSVAGEKRNESRAIATHIPGSVIRIATDYHGKRLLIYGVRKPGCDVILKLTSKENKHVAFAKKGRVGIFWLTTGRVAFDNVPTMYKIRSTRPLAEILPPEELVSLGLGRESLFTSIESPAGTPRFILADLISSREEEKLFSFHRAGVSLIKDNLFEASFFWPSKAPPGEYRVESIAVRDGKVISVDSECVRVEKVGMEGWISNLAVEHGFAYGFLAIFVALASGLLVGLLFRGMGGRRRRGVRTVH